MTEVRCTECNALLGKFDGRAEVKCRKCKTINYINTGR